MRSPTYGPRSRRYGLAVAAALALLPASAAQDVAPGAPDRPGRPDREATWPAPTAEDWARPCLVQWQRSWEDAVAVSKETSKPILVCVNMDGEIASEHYAGVRYRQPETAALYGAYVCVIASVYRHTPRDYDEQGRRVTCPRFGGVTCGEHIWIEPGLFESYFADQRVAPRHIGVELQLESGAIDTEKAFDVFYAWDTATVFDAIRKGVEGRPEPAPRRGDLSIPELVASRDAEHRAQVETRYQQGDREQRRALLEAAAAHGEAAPVDLLRLAVFGVDDELGGLARRALAASNAPAAVDLIVETLELPLGAADREALLAALARLGESSPRAHTIAFAHRALAAPSAVDVGAWEQALETPEAGRPSSPAVAVPLERQNAILASDDAQAHLDLAEGLLALAEAEPDPGSARVLYLDAQQTARKAEALGAYGGRLNSALALAALSLGETQEARSRIAGGALDVAAVPAGRGAVRLLELYARDRQRAIAKAVREQADWPAEWLADVDAAYTVLRGHPHGSDAHVLSHYDFVRWFGASAHAQEILEAGLARFPESWDLHDRYRAHLLRTQGVRGLESAYERRLAEPEAPGRLRSLAGYASLVAAEFHRRSGRADEAEAAYGRAIAHYERSLHVDREHGDEADHYIALALAGRARVAYEQGDDESALDDLLSCFARRPASAAALDGLNVSPVDTARLLQARLGQQGRDGPLTALENALDALDPELLGLPAYERGEPGEAPAPRGR